MQTFQKTSAFLFTLLILTACGRGSGDSGVDIQETAQQVGDMMASVDESSGASTGTLTMLEDTHSKTFARMEKNSDQKSRPDFDLAEWLTPKSAFAQTCSFASTFGSCSGAGVITRNFGGCTIGIATFTGTVTLTWSNGSACSMGASTQYVTRVPNFTVTGRRGATLTVSKSGAIGQRLTWFSGVGATRVFKFSNDGIRRVFSAGGSPLFDFTTTTTSDITVTGTNRDTSRVMNGGTLRVMNNLTNVSCDYTPSSATWSSTCNCPTSGSFSASCSDGTTSAITLTGCGTANFTLGSDSQAVTFDRCYGT